MQEKTSWAEVHKREATEHVKNFYGQSYSWMSTSFHAKFDRWENNYRSIYDPAIKALKESWQATMFQPLTVSQVETICCAITKILLGKEHPIGFKPREAGDLLQAELNAALLEHQLEKSSFPTVFYEVLKEALIFGSGFMKLYWRKDVDKRKVRTPLKYTFGDAAQELLKGRVVPLGGVKGYENQIQNVVVREGVYAERVHIRDIFLEPNSLDLKRLIHRSKLTYGELLDMAKQGYFDKESVEKLRGVSENKTFESEVAVVKANQGITDTPVQRTDYDKRHTVWEYWGPVPRKWTNPDMPEDTEKQKEAANEMVPGKIMVASGEFYLGCWENDQQSMEPPFIKADYIPTGQTFGMGVAELIEGVQEELNEIRNLRVDNVNLIINKVFVAIENNIVDPKDVISRPGQVIRVKGSDLDDARKALYPLEIPDVTNSAYKETYELERIAQEVTGANRVTTGSAGMVKDQNQTLGGMELLRQAAADRFTTYAYLIGRKFLVKAAMKYIESIYINMPDEMIQRILGIRPIEHLPGEILPRFELYHRADPLDIEMAYDIVPYDVFSEENKFAKSQSMKSYGQFLATVLPQWNPVPLAKKIGSLDGLSEDEVTEIIGEIQTPMPTPMGMDQGVPSISKFTNPSANQNPSPTSPNPLAANGAAPQ